MQIPKAVSLLTIGVSGFLLLMLYDVFYRHPDDFVASWPVVVPLIAGLLTMMMPFPSLHAWLDGWVAENAEPLPEPSERSFGYSFVMLRVWLVNGTQWIWDVTRALKIPAVRSGLRVTLLPFLLMVTAAFFAGSLAVSVLGWDSRPAVRGRPGRGKHGRRPSPFRRHGAAPSFEADDLEDEEPVRDSRVSYGARALPERWIAVCYQQPGFVEVCDAKGGRLFTVTGGELLGYTDKTVTVRMGSFVQTMDHRGRVMMSRVEG